MYNQGSTKIKDFQALKTIVLWAGWLGLIQSTVWMGLNITAILAYNCIVSVAPMLTYGSLLQTVFLDVYFKGSCTPSTYQQYDATILHSVPTVLDPTQILIWDCVYLAISVGWLLTSVLLLTHVRKDDVKTSLGVICTWLCFAGAVCAMDIALGVIFGIDYGRFHDAAYNYNINSINAGEIYPNAAQLLAGATAAIAMMIVSFKGFVLWLINVGLFAALLLHAIAIAKDRDIADTLFMPRKDSDEILSTRPPPIRAYEETKTQVFSNEAFVPDNRSIDTVEVNEEAIVRAAHMSRDASLFDRRFRNIDSFQQYPAPANQNGVSRISSVPIVQETVITATSSFPAPDYSPQPIRANQQNPNVQLRSQRF